MTTSVELGTPENLPKSKFRAKTGDNFGPAGPSGKFLVVDNSGGNVEKK